jgi:hypothetical protein
MDIPAPEEIRNTIFVNLLNANIYKKEYLNAESKLIALGIKEKNETRLSVVYIVEDVIHYYFDELCKLLTLNHNGDMPGLVSMNKDLYQCPRNTRFSLCHADNASLDELDKLHEEVLDGIDFNTIHQHLAQQVSSLRQRGLNIIVEQIFKALSLKSYRGYHSQKSLSTKVRRIICTTSPATSRYTYQACEEIYKLSEALNLISEQSDIDYGNGLTLLIADIQALGYHQAIPSRTVYGKGNILEIHCFLSKYEFRFSLDAFEAIHAFILLNGSEEQIEELEHSLELLNQAEVV